MSGGQGYESDTLTEFDGLAEEHQKELAALDKMAKQLEAERPKGMQRMPQGTSTGAMCS